VLRRRLAAAGLPADQQWQTTLGVADQRSAE